MRISHADLGTQALPAAILRVLREPQYAAAAERISTRMRARPRTPLQEAAGARAQRQCQSCMHDAPAGGQEINEEESTEDGPVARGQTGLSTCWLPVGSPT